MRADDEAVNLVEKLEAGRAKRSPDDTDGTLTTTASEGGDATSRSSTYSLTPVNSVVASDMEEEEVGTANVARQTKSTLEATNEMCFYTFDVLLEELLVTQAKSSKTHHHKHGISHLFGGSHSPSSGTKKKAAAEDEGRLELIDFVCTLPDSEASCPLFVTWDKWRPETRIYELRGCIGTLAPRVLASALGEYAITSALHDRRFQPIRIREVPELRVAVSLLIDYEECGSNVHDWTVGKHGIVLKFDHHDSPYSATYLPEVALEQNWTQEEAVRSLVRKAGCHSNVNAEFIFKSQMTCTRYQSSKLRMTYQEYVKVRHNGVDPLGPEDGHETATQREDSDPSHHHKFQWRKCFKFS